MTEQDINRTKALFSSIAKEPVEVQEIGATIYGFCSELAALRLFHKYNCSKCRAGYSENLKTWYFSLDKWAWA